MLGAIWGGLNTPRGRKLQPLWARSRFYRLGPQTGSKHKERPLRDNSKSDIALLAQQAVRPLAERLDLANRLAAYDAHHWDGNPIEGPILHIDDFSGIPFLVDITGVEEYQHRARLRATAGDLYVATTKPTVGYESYCEAKLGLAPVEFLTAEPVDKPMYLARAAGAGETRSHLLAAARSAGRLTLHPFMGIADIWDLGRTLAEEAEVLVTVLAPPPPATWVANDKALFDEVVDLVLGRRWLVETYSSDSVEDLGRYLRQLAGGHIQVALKRLRCASAMGNAVFDSAQVSEKSPSELEQTVREFLDRTEWVGDEAVLAVAWEQAEHSPSTQLWIPPIGKGAPRLDGVYEQLLMGERKVFMGSRPSTLPEEVNRRLASGSLDVAWGLQALGYVGRCSFDFLVVGDPQADFEIRFTECNGRWGGTSTPMSLLDRLFPSGRPPYRARDFVHPALVGASFPEQLSQVGDAAWDHRTREGKFIFYNTGPLARFGKLDVIALGETQAEADRALEEELPLLWGL